MSSHQILQVTKEYRAGKHQFVTVGTSSNLDDSLNDQVDNASLQTLTMVGGNVGIGTTIPLAKTHLFLSEYGHLPWLVVMFVPMPTLPPTMVSV